MLQREAGHRSGGLRLGVTVARMLLWLTAATNIVAAYYPLELEPPLFTANQLTRLDDGALRVNEYSFAHTEDAPDWLPAAIEESTFSVELEVRPDGAAFEEVARIFTVSQDYHERNLTIGQTEGDLIVRLRRPGSSPSGTPPFVVPGALSDGQWHAIAVSVTDDRLEVSVDGAVALAEDLRPRPLANWDPTHRVALGDELNRGRPWSGQIRRAVVQVPGATVDYLEPGALEAPQTLLTDPGRPGSFVRSLYRGAVTDDYWHLAGAIPFSFLFVALARPRRPLLAAAGAAAVLGIVIEIGQIPFLDRQTELIDVALQVAGGVLGGAIAVVTRARAIPETASGTTTPAR